MEFRDFTDFTKIIENIKKSPKTKINDYVDSYQFYGLTIYVCFDSYINFSSLYSQLTKRSLYNPKTTKIKTFLLESKETVIFDLTEEQGLEGYWIEFKDLCFCVSQCCWKEWRFWFSKDREMIPGFIYLLKDDKTNELTIECKIGKTSNFKNREDSDYSRNHPNMKLIGIYSTYNIDTFEKIIKKLKDTILKDDIINKTKEYFNIYKTKESKLISLHASLNKIFAETIVNDYINENVFTTEYIQKLKELFELQLIRANSEIENYI